MKTFEEVKERLDKSTEDLRRRYKVRQVGIFGSYVTGEQSEDADLDIIVEFAEPIGLFEFMDLEEYLESLVGTRVDLVSKNALKPHMGERILQEVIYL